MATLILHLPSALIVSKIPSTLLGAFSFFSPSTADDDTGNEWIGDDDKADITPSSATASLTGSALTHLPTPSRNLPPTLSTSNFPATFLDALSYIIPSTADADDEWTLEPDELRVGGSEPAHECAFISSARETQARLSKWLLLARLASPARNLFWQLLASFNVPRSSLTFCW